MTPYLKRSCNVSEPSSSFAKSNIQFARLLKPPKKAFTTLVSAEAARRVVKPVQIIIYQVYHRLLVKTFSEYFFEPV